MSLTKTLQIDEDVLDVLKNQVIWAEEENGDWIAYMPQLDPDLYRKIKRIFQHPKLDGTWVKRRDGTVFPKDPRPMLFQVQETGKMEIPRDGFFRTPPELTEKLLSLMAINPADNTKKWLEPSCGDGAIIRVLKSVAEEGQITAVEQNEDRVKFVVDNFPGVHIHLADFMKWPMIPVSYDYIIMNPPFEKGQDMDHIRRAYSYLKRGGKMAAILSEGPFYRTDEKSVNFRFWLNVVGAHNEKLPDGAFRSSGTGVATRFILVEKE
jgi:hypothetical protein